MTGVVTRIRRNHGLEHATIHVLSEGRKQFSAQGNSDHRGFRLNIYGEVSEADVAAAVAEALRRLRAGERQLAVHPNCGTVLVTTATLATLTAQAMFALEERRAPSGGSSSQMLGNRLNALPGAILAVVLALIVGRPLGLTLQERYTVDGNVGDLDVVSVRPVPLSLVARLFHLLLTAGNRSLPPASYFVRTSGGEG
jgi:hypothetical protein